MSELSVGLHAGEDSAMTRKVWTPYPRWLALGTNVTGVNGRLLHSVAVGVRTGCDAIFQRFVAQPLALDRLIPTV